MSSSSALGARSFAEANGESPLYFGPGGRPLFAWLHPAAGGRRADFGLVICNPFGYEATCAHRSIRLLARELSSLGVPVLRFDYAGTGDSEDLVPESDQISAWRDDIVAAAGKLQRLAGVSRIRLLGLRLGFLLAALAAAECPAVEGLIGVMPVIEGRRYLRELHRMRLSAARPGAVLGTAVEGEIEVGGFSLSAASVRTLAEVNLSSRPAPGIRDLLLIDRDDLPAATAWKSSWPDARTTTRYVTQAGFVEMLMTPPYFARTPEGVLTELRDWVGARVPRETTGEARMPAEGGGQLVDSAAIRGAVFDPTADLGAPSIERAVTFSSDPPLFGIVTEPGSTEQRRRVVILLNDGATHHIGASRLNVILARRWARRGYHVMRMDLAGLGDSAARPGEPANEVFPPHAVDDVRAATEYMRRHYGAREVTLGGLCSGAYHALRAAAAGLAVDRVLLINPENFLARDAEAEALGDLEVADVMRNPLIYRHRMLSPAYWKRVVTGQVDLGRVLRIYRHRMTLAVGAALRNAARRLGIPLPRDLGREIEGIAARGIQLVFVFARGEAGIELLKLQAGNSLRRIGARCRIHVIDGADHVFSRADSRSRLEATLSEELFAPHERGVSTPSRPGTP